MAFALLLSQTWGILFISNVYHQNLYFDSPQGGVFIDIKTFRMEEKQSSSRNYFKRQSSSSEKDYSAFLRGERTRNGSFEAEDVDSYLESKKETTSRPVFIPSPQKKQPGDKKPVILCSSPKFSKLYSKRKDSYSPPSPEKRRIPSEI